MILALADRETLAMETTEIFAAKYPLDKNAFADQLPKASATAVMIRRATNKYNSARPIHN
jgi:hypothetical protein